MLVTKCSSQIAGMASVRYWAGWGVFSLTRPRRYTGPGEHFSPGPCPGPRFLPPIFDGACPGHGWGGGPVRGKGRGMDEKTPRPALVSGVGRGI